MKIAILVINKSGEKLAKKLKTNFKEAKIIKGREKKASLTSLVGDIFKEYDGLIFIAALGIVTRLISPFIKNKLSDPAVVCVDTAGRFSISVLSGHEGGANNLSFLAAAALDASPVVTTGAETHKKIIVGIGCRRKVITDEVKKAIFTALKEKNIGLEEIRLVATVDFKKKETDLIEACSELKLPLVFISRETIRNFKGPISSSEVVRDNVGLEGVCEPCALLAGRRAKLILKKRVLNGVTIAIAQES